MENNINNDENKIDKISIYKIVITILIVIVIGLFGYTIYNNYISNDKSSNAETTTTTTSVSTTEKATATETSTQPTQNTTKAQTQKSTEPASNDKATYDIYELCDNQTKFIDEYNMKSITFLYVKGVPCIEWVHDSYPDNFYLLSLGSEDEKDGYDAFYTGEMYDVWYDYAIKMNSDSIEIVRYDEESNTYHTGDEMQDYASGAEGVFYKK